MVAGLAIVAATLSVISPVLLIFVPFALLVIVLPPRRPMLVALGAIILLAGLGGTGSNTLWYVARGWTLVLGAWFVTLVALWPGTRFLPRALGALAGATASFALLLGLNDGGWQRLDWAVTRQLRGTAADMAGLWSQSAGAEPWAAELSRSVYQAVELQAVLHPALLALASLAALGVAWWGYRRLAAGESRPLAPLREFRFHDALVWVLVAGIVLVILPLGEPAVRTGSNVLAFMAALYMLRGIAVVLAVMGGAGVGGALFGLIALFFLPMVMVASVLVGLTDTWLDLRARRSAARPGS